MVHCPTWCIHAEIATRKEKVLKAIRKNRMGVEKSCVSVCQKGRINGGLSRSEKKEQKGG
jgi:hypothetical protein